MKTPPAAKGNGIRHHPRVERAAQAGVEAELDVWRGMPHGFVTGVREFDAARLSLDAIGAFLTERLS